MDISLIIQVLGIYLVVSGLFMLFRGKTLPLVVKDLVEHRGIMWLAGFVLIMLGGIVAFGAIESTIITIVGWLMLLKGIVYILAPETLKLFVLRFPRSLLTILGIGVMALGLYFLGVF